MLLMDWNPNKNCSSVAGMHNKPNEQEPPQQDWAQYTNMAVGEILRRTREYYNLRIEDVERALRIRASQLTALEEGDVSKLPGRVYAIGFVRAYSEFLGLDGDKMVHLFKAQLVGHKPRPELNFPVPASESKLPNLYILGGSFAGLALVGVVALLMASPWKSHDIPEVPQQIQDQMANYGPPSPDSLNAIAPASGAIGLTAVPESRITINVVDNAWVEIRNAEGKALISRILKKGDSYIVPNEPGMVMDTGNIGALEFTIDGVPGNKLGETGDVKRGVSLDPEKLKPVPVAVPAPASATPVPPAAKPGTEKPVTTKPVVQKTPTKNTTTRSKRAE